MAGIYIHIPFCKQACHYCNFHFVTSLHYKNELVAALLKELELRTSYLQGESIDTIYFGGGTPSLCSAEELKNILNTIHSFHVVNEEAEITMEVNPDDISNESLLEWISVGINRLSIGIQSFYEEDLKWMNRAHSSEQAISNMQLAKTCFDNISIDLIYGTPHLTNEKWKENVDRVIAAGIPHISCYALTVESKTPLDKMIRLKQANDVSTDQQAEQFLLLMGWLRAAGYEHYEISNFAKPGWRSRHNTSYWCGKKYQGIGPSAHSFDGGSRQWNLPNNNRYIESLNKGELLFEKETLTETQKRNEYIMTSLRTMEGMNIERAGIEVLDRAAKYLEAGYIERKAGNIILTDKGKFLADGIAADLFY